MAGYSANIMDIKPVTLPQLTRELKDFCFILQEERVSKIIPATIFKSLGNFY